MSLINDYLEIRRKIIEKDFARMNDMQRQAVYHTKGPLLILAGAGSGKTTVLVNRIANLIRYGDAYLSDTIPYGTSENEVKLMKSYLNGESNDFEAVRPYVGVNCARPWQILAITFTNKAAGELKERLTKMLGEDGNDIWAATFHSTCARMLRRDAGLIGYDSHFAVYDTADQKRLIKDCLAKLNINEKNLPVRSVMNEISNAKDSQLSPAEYAKSAGNDFRLKKIAEVYSLYQKQLKANDAMDFDDLMFNTVKLLEKNPEVLEYYQNKFKYIMVDEYQDTNMIQYRFVSLLAQKNRNLCVVGDDDQSIYKFRGATIENILSFENQYSDAKVIRLEQNYRSTQTILDAANEVIKKNSSRKGKSLWTSNGQGEKITLHLADNEQEEARYIADTVLENVNKGARYSDHAVLYRMNAQASALERALVKCGVPYRILAGMRFYEHKEIKDILAYLSIINNPADNVRLERIINEPKRGIGQTSVNNAAEIAEGMGISIFDVIKDADQYAVLSRSAVKMKSFARLIDSLIEDAEEMSLSELYKEVLAKTGYREMLEQQGEEAQSRIENLDEFASTIANYEQENDEGGLAEFLEEISLMTDVDNYDKSADAVVLMTIHAAKGLEFPYVFMAGMEEGIFPGMMSILSPDEIEEERRLAYVGITRAKKQLYATYCHSRMLYGKTNRNKLSRFIEDIPSNLVERTGVERSYMKNNLEAYTSAFESKKKPTIVKRTGLKNDQAKGAAASGVAVNFIPGDMVSHRVFGQGMVISIQPMGNDALIEVAFDKVGTKKIMANFAKLKKI